MSPRPIFDSVSLYAIVCELQSWAGGEIQGVDQPKPTEVSLVVNCQNSIRRLLVSLDPRLPLMLASTIRPPKGTGHLSTFLHKRLKGARITAIRQLGFDRITLIDVETAEGDRERLVAELTGNRCNLFYLDSEGRALAAARWIPPAKSKHRPMQPGSHYSPPPGYDPDRKTPLDAQTLEACKGWLSPFSIEQAEQDFQAWQNRLKNLEFSPVAIYDEEKKRIIGAYPFPVGTIPAQQQVSRESLSNAWEQAAKAILTARESEQTLATLAGQIAKALDARQSALQDVRMAAQDASEADKWQRYGELILAYGYTAKAKSFLEAPDYGLEGSPIAQIDLDPEKSTPENAAFYFDKAKRSRENLEGLQRRAEAIEQEIERLQAFLLKLEGSTDLDKLKEEAEQQGWLRIQRQQARRDEEKPFGGHRVRQLLSPDGYQVLMGESAQANDYLTTKVASPNDIWLHVRQAVGAHVVIRTENRPERVPRRTIEFAALAAARNSADKHAGAVLVDYTLKKHVRKPRKSAPGIALYTRERTITVNPRQGN
ncbi:MAG: fibronectin-binding domain-containing protein [Armatimonadetes bacterium]|nr:fibronectin-binding domain-containing protein [Armatimonadota bacterium]